MEESEFRVGQRVHSAGDPQRIGSVAYVGPIDGYSGEWVGVEWDAGDGKHDGSVNGVRYFRAKSEWSGSFVRAHNLSFGISLLEALYLRYRSESTKEEEDEMYVFLSSNKRVSVELLGKDKIQDKLSRFEELTGVSLSFLGVSSSGSSSDISSLLPNLKALELTGNLLSDWKNIGTICKELPALSALNLSYNLMPEEIVDLPLLRNLRTLVLNNTGLKWTQVEHSLPAIEELHLMGNNISTLDKKVPEILIHLNTLSQVCSISSFQVLTSLAVQGFDSLRLLNLDDNCIADWREVMKLPQLKRCQYRQSTFRGR